MVRSAARIKVIGVSLVTATALAVPWGSPAVADGDGDRIGNNDTSRKLREAVTLEGVLQHLEKFQQIADDNDGNRAAGLPGYEASADYVAGQLRRVGYRVQRQDFDFPFFLETADPELEQVSPDQTVYVSGEDFITMTFSGSGDVTAVAQAVDLALDDPATSTSGCEAADFTDFEAGNVALIQRGTCSFADKAVNAENAGASGVIIFNQGNGDDRMDAFAGTLGGDVVDIPVVGASFPVGQDLADPAGTTVRLFTETISETRTTTNVIAESRGGDPDNVVMLGAHLDSVPEGVGYNDNGSGSAAILEVARQMSRVRPENRVRFAWWGAEELGLVGSTEYVGSLSEQELDDIALYLNFDMVGSPNFIRGVYDGDGSSFGMEGPPGSDAIERLFNRHFGRQALPYQATEFSGRSDYQAFINNGIPSGGLFTGADGTKTEAEEETYGGVAGAIYDPCYHQACDSRTPVGDGADRYIYAELYEENNLIGNIAPVALDTNADAIAHAAIRYAQNLSGVGGARSDVAPQRLRAPDAGRLSDVGR